jgi:RNA polymerase sigma-70 factor (ECF subfamily)
VSEHSPINPTPGDGADDRRLLRRMRRGDERAASTLWRLHAPRLTAYARTIAGSQAEDAVQEAFLSAIRLRSTEVRGVRDVGAWFTTVTRRAALNIARSESRERDRRELAGDRMGVSASAKFTDPAFATQAPGENRDILDAMAGLDPDLREPVALHRIAGLSFAEVASVLGVPRGTAADRYRRGIEQLRVALASPEAPGPADPPGTAGAPGTTGPPVAQAQQERTRRNGQARKHVETGGVMADGVQEASA